MGNGRPRGILTPHRRDYLRGETDIEPQSNTERAIRSDIRENLKNSLLDFPILLYHLREDDMRQVIRDDDVVENRWPIRHTIPHLLGFAYWATLQNPGGEGMEDVRLLETMLEEGVRMAVGQVGAPGEYTKNVEVDITVELADERAEYTGDNLFELPRDALLPLLLEGEITELEYANAIQRFEDEEDEEGQEEPDDVDEE
ncbi:hypothetical protein [Halopelagius fulvigenes]|uniref:Domain of unknown function domain-containing protein n=1 Tax=Halopelagius fulvigenes TaxID=1198324 RepID=A0ABD5TW33_9EURY